MSKESFKRTPTDQVLLISGRGQASGGLFAWDEVGLEVIDWAGAGVFAVNGSKLVQLVSDQAVPPGAQLIIYDAAGAQRSSRCDRASDAHSVLWDTTDDVFIVAGTHRNSILWIDRAGEVLKEWRAPGELDSWHLSGLLEHEGTLYASAFGKFTKYREWSDHIAFGTGIVFEVSTGREVLTGLCCPHNPLFFDGHWSVCNSHRGEVLQIDPVTKEITRRARLNGFTRGMAITEDSIYVGVSTNDYAPFTRDNASVAVLSRETWEVEAIVEVACREIDEIAFSPRPLVGGVRYGFGPHISGRPTWLDSGRHSDAGETPALAEEDCRVELEAEVPPVLGPACVVEVRYTVKNLGAKCLKSALPHPVHLSYHWVPAVDSAEGIRSSLPRPIAAHDQVTGRMLIRTPSSPGASTLRISLVQENVRWFDEVSDTNGWSREIQIRPDR